MPSPIQYSIQEMRTYISLLSPTHNWYPKSNSLFCLLNVGLFHLSFSIPIIFTLVHATILSHLDYGKRLLNGFSNSSLLSASWPKPTQDQIYTKKTYNVLPDLAPPHLLSCLWFIKLTPLELCILSMLFDLSLLIPYIFCFSWLNPTRSRKPSLPTFSVPSYPSTQSA